MTERNKRRAAARKARKLENKKSAHQYLTRAAGQSQPAAIADQTTGSPINPAPEHPVSAARLNYVEALVSGEPDKRPISELQLNANRANAQLSTGPLSAEGKAVSARNNFRHGLTQTEGELVLLEDESREEYSQSLAAFQAEWQPATATEQDLVERLAAKQWLRRRAMKLQKLYLAHNGQIIDYDQFALYRRYEASHERGYNKALADLMRLRALRLREENGFESQRRKNEEHAFRIRTLQNREKLQQLALRTAEAKAKLHEGKLALALNPPKQDAVPEIESEMRPVLPKAATEVPDLPAASSTNGQTA